MIREIRVRTSGISGTGNTFYDMIDDIGNLIFQEVWGASFSGAGITYALDREVATFTVSTERLTATDTYSYNSASLLGWPASSSGYTLYTGVFTSQDDGYSTTAVTLPTAFSANNDSSTSLYLSTNGYFTLGSGSGNILGSPQQQPNPAAMAGQTGDLWLQKGLVNTDGDTQNFYYKTGSDSANKYYVKLLVYCGTYASSTTPKSYVINFYRDTSYQWLEARAKSNTSGNVGPYNATDVSQPSSTLSMVWRGDLNGQNWAYLGTGSVGL